MIPALISAAAGLAGGLLNRSSARDANQQNLQNQLRQEALQKEFAQHGIQWKVADARAAGVHPLYALGANTVSYSPSSVGAVADTSFGSAVASSGQDISRAITASSTARDRATAFDRTVQQLSLTKMGLENDLLASQIAKLRSQIGPPMPTLTDTTGQQPLVVPGGKVEAADPVQVSGFRWLHDPSTTNADSAEKRYGEMSDWLAGPLILWNDMVYNSQRTSKNWWGGSQNPRTLREVIRDAVKGRTVKGSRTWED